MRRIRLGTDLSLGPPARTVHLIRPLRPDRPKATPSGESVWPGWAGTAEWFELTALEECDVAVLPFPWEDALADETFRTAAAAFCARAEALARSVFVFYHDDPTITVPFPNAVLFAHSLHASRRAENEFALPGWIPWPPHRVHVRPYPERPVVGFAGKAWPFGFDHGSASAKLSVQMRYLAGSLLVRSGINDRLNSPVTFYERAMAVRQLERDPRIETRLLLRDARPVADAEAYRREYFDSIEQTDYTLAVRGMGNFSYRLYEALAHGRIPLFVNSDCVLPLDSEIDWRSLCVWIEGATVRTIADQLFAAHRAMTHEDFEERQRRCQDVWMTKLTEPGYFSRLHERLSAGVAAGGLSGSDGRKRLLGCLS
jgi:hypothetical protein